MFEGEAARVLVVEDDSQLRRAVANALTARGYLVTVAEDGGSALRAAEADDLDLILLDLGLPDLDGNDVIGRLREWSTTPVIVLSVRDEQEQKAAALDAGADDFVTKPFGMTELLARMRAVVRRSRPPSKGMQLRFGDLHVDLDKQMVSLSDEPIHLTPTEYRLLEAMVTSPGKLLTHRWLLQEVWGPGYGTESHYLRLFVRQLRKKLHDDPAKPRWITTEPGVGYRWIGESEA